MCTVSVISLLGVSLFTGGSILSASGQYKADKSNQKVLEFQEDATLQQSETVSSSLNARAKEGDYQANEAVRKSNFIENRFRRQVQGDIGSVKTKLAVSGVQINSGSSQRVLDSVARAGAMDQIILEQNNALEVWGYKARAEKFRSGAAITKQRGRIQANLFKFQAEETGRAANRRFTSTLLTSFGNLALTSYGSTGKIDTTAGRTGGTGAYTTGRYSGSGQTGPQRINWPTMKSSTGGSSKKNANKIR